LARQPRFENTFKLCLALDPWQIGELHDNVIGKTAQQLGLRSSVREAPGIVSGWPQPSFPSEPARPIAFLLSLLSSSVPPYGLIGRTSSSAPFRFSTVDNRHADEAQACRRVVYLSGDHLGKRVQPAYPRMNPASAADGSDVST